MKIVRCLFTNYTATRHMTITAERTSHLSSPVLVWSFILQTFQPLNQIRSSTMN